MPYCLPQLTEQGKLSAFDFIKEGTSMNLLDFFIQTAHADAPAANASAQGAGGFSMMLMLTIFVVFMYFVVWRPQNKRAKEHRNLLSSLSKGDEVMSAGGILGRVAKLTDQYVMLNISENVEIVVQRSSIMTLLPKGTLKSVV